MLAIMHPLKKRFTRKRVLQKALLASFLIICSSYFLLSCKTKNENCINYRFDEKDYILFQLKKDTSGFTYFKLYRSKIDTNEYVAKSFWDNGNIQSSMFFSGKLRNGPFKMYDINGTISFESVYLMNKQNGLEIYYNRGAITDFTVFSNGKELQLDTSVKIAMLKNLSIPR